MKFIVVHGKKTGNKIYLNVDEIRAFEIDSDAEISVILKDCTDFVITESESQLRTLLFAADMEVCE